MKRMRVQSRQDFSDMQPRPPFDRELLIVIAVGLISILGLAWIFSTNDLSETPIPPTLEPTAIPFEYLGTAPPPSATPTLKEMTPTVTATAIRTSPPSYPGPPAETLPSASTLSAGSRPVLSVTSAPGQGPPLPIGKYDDTDPNIAYDRSWSVLKTGGTKNAYKGTIHVSAGIGSEASFRFTGQRFSLGYQRGKNFGIVTVIIDDQSYSFHEQAFDLVWRSPELSPGTHFVRIIHESGEWINLDYIQVLE